MKVVMSKLQQRTKRRTNRNGDGCLRGTIPRRLAPSLNGGFFQEYIEYIK